MFEKKPTSSSTGESEEQGARPWCQCSGFPLQAWAAPAMFANRGFSGLPDAKLTCFLLLALELLYPACVLRAFLWITVRKLFSTQKVSDGKIHFWGKIAPKKQNNYFPHSFLKSSFCIFCIYPEFPFSLLFFCIPKIKKEPKILHLFSQNCFA